jgi:hypothetical protein
VACRFDACVPNVTPLKTVENAREALSSCAIGWPGPEYEMTWRLSVPPPPPADTWTLASGVLPRMSLFLSRI